MAELAPDLPRSDRYRLTADLHFLATDQNGRQSPFASDYRAPCWFGLHDDDGRRLYHDVFWFFRRGDDTFDRDGLLWVAPGGRCMADGLVVHPEYLRPIAAPGLEFDVWEGRAVARGIVRAVFDPEAPSD
jgi:hypothetical protein